MTKIYHNPRCSKSRETLAILKDQNEEVEIIEYLQSPPSESELREIINLLGASPLELIRKGESIFKEQFKSKELNDSEWIKVMIENPKLIERPIVIKDNQAVIGRPPKKILEIL